MDLLLQVEVLWSLLKTQLDILTGADYDLELHTKISSDSKFAFCPAGKSQPMKHLFL